MPASSRTIKRQPVTVNLPTPGTPGWVNPAENPEETNAAINKILEEATVAPSPEIDFPQADIVTLPGGLIRKDTIIRSVEVKELTGEDEESLAKASQSQNPLSFLDRLLRCGVVRIGDEPKDEKLLGQMLIGDRESVILGIRKATYGDEIKIDQWECPNCSSKADLTFTTDDIPVVKMADPSDARFEIDLRKGGKAKVRLANGEDQLAIFEKTDLTQAERDTVLLSRCVISISDVSGKEKLMAVYPSMSRSMSIPDRHAILNQLGERQPGPKYNQIKFNCDNCRQEQSVAVTIGHLFLDFGWI